MQQHVAQSADAVEEELLVVGGKRTANSRIRTARRRQLEDRPEEEEGRVAGIAQLLQGLEEGGLALALGLAAGGGGPEEQGTELGGG